MQTATLKVDIISWISRLNDKRILEDLYRLSTANHVEHISVQSDGFIPPKRVGKLTEGFGLWADSSAESITDYRKEIWQSEKNAW
jgi:hypothetical protein